MAERHGLHDPDHTIGAQARLEDAKENIFKARTDKSPSTTDTGTYVCT